MSFGGARLGITVFSTENMASARAYAACPIGMPSVHARAAGLAHAYDGENAPDRCATTPLRGWGRRQE